MVSKHMISLFFIMLLECRGDSSIQFPPVVTTYTVPVPVFGGDAAVEGVLTAARNTESGDLSSLYSQSEPFYPPAEYSGSDGSSTFQIPASEYGVPSSFAPETAFTSLLENSNEAGESVSTVQENAGILPIVGPIPSSLTNNSPTPSSTINSEILSTSVGQQNIGTASSSSGHNLVTSLAHTASTYAPPVEVQSGNIGTNVADTLTGQNFENSSPSVQSINNPPFSHTVPIYAPPVGVENGNAAVGITGAASTGQQNTHVFQFVANNPSSNQELANFPFDHVVPLYAPSQGEQNGNAGLSVVDQSSSEQEDTGFALFIDSSFLDHYTSGQGSTSPLLVHLVPVYAPPVEVEGGSVPNIDSNIPSGQENKDIVQISAPTVSNSAASTQEINRPLSDNRPVPTNYAPPIDLPNGIVAASVAPSSPSISQEQIGENISPHGIYAPSGEAQSGSVATSSSSSGHEQIEELLISTYAPPVETPSGNCAFNVASSSAFSGHEQIATFPLPSVSYSPPAEVQTSNVDSSVSSFYPPFVNEQSSLPYVLPLEEQSSSFPSTSAHQQASDIISSSAPYAPPLEIQAGNVAYTAESSSSSGHEEVGEILPSTISYIPHEEVQYANVPSNIPSSLAHEQTGQFLTYPLNFHSYNTTTSVTSSASSGEEQGGFKPYISYAPPIRSKPGNGVHEVGHQKTNKVGSPAAGFASSLTTGSSNGQKNVLSLPISSYGTPVVV